MVQIDFEHKLRPFLASVSQFKVSWDFKIVGLGPQDFGHGSLQGVHSRRLLVGRTQAIFAQLSVA